MPNNKSSKMPSGPRPRFDMGTEAGFVAYFTRHIVDPELKELYVLALTKPYDCLLRGEKLLPASPDAVAVLGAMREACEKIVNFFLNCGMVSPEQRARYGNHDLRYFQSYASRLVVQIGELEKKGKRSDVLEKFESQKQKRGA